MDRRARQNDAVQDALERRLGRVHARQRLGIEDAYEARAFGQGLNFFHPENLRGIQALIRGSLRLVGLYGRGHRNTQRLQVRRTTLALPDLPPAFDGFTILHLSDLHVDMNRGAMHRLTELLPDLRYDICVLTGDFRGRTCGPYDATLSGLASVRANIVGPVYAVLGNHDTIRMVPGMEQIGIRVLLNEAEAIARGDERLWLAGIDDAHYYRVDNIEKAATEVPSGAFAVLLSHTPEIYRQAAHADFRLLLSGHTHGGQICLPGAVPITLDSALPRKYGSGMWRYEDMIGYTSVGVGSSIVPVRFNCPPEVALHRLARA
jgi:predicted MPP superfamily phosphohydrolase